MIPIDYCQVKNCQSQLTDIEEIDMGFCLRHRDKLRSVDHFTLACWACGSLIETVHKRIFDQKAMVRDEYIFAKTCPHCDTAVKMSSLQYMTIKPKELSTYTLINEHGQLVIDGKTVKPIASVRRHYRSKRRSTQ